MGKVKYIPHKSKRPYLLLGAAVVKTAFKEIKSYYEKGEPEEHGGKAAIAWIANQEGNYPLFLKIVSHISNESTEEAHRILLQRIEHTRKKAAGLLEKEKPIVRSAYELMSV